MDLACAADEAYVPHCAAMIHSALSTHAPGSITIHFLRAPDVRDATVAALDAMTTANGGHFVVHSALDHQVSDLPLMDRLPAVMWYRVLLPQLLPTTERVLYVDCDTLIVDDLSPLWELDLADYYVAAVTNAFETGDERHATALGLESVSDYFNSGVLLFNLDLMRADGATDTILECARTRELIWPDQDALNLTLGTRRLPLEPRWNCMNILYFGKSATFLYRDPPPAFGPRAATAATAHPAILHFEGPNMAKPWHYLNRHPCRSTYFAHRRATPWPRVEVEGRTWTNRLLRLLPNRMVNKALRLEYRARQRLRLN